MVIEARIAKTVLNGFYLEIFRIKNNKKIFWAAKILDENKSLEKEFFDSSREFLKLKALEWIISENRQC